MAEEVGSLRVAVALDTVSFNQGIASMSKQMQIVGQDFKNASGGLDKVGDASKISALKIAELTSKIDLQKGIVEKFRQAHKDAAEQFGEGSKKALDYELKLKRAEGTLQGMERQLSSTTAEFKEQEKWVNKNAAELTKLDGKLDNLKGTLGKVGSGLKVAAIGLAAMGAAFGALAIASVKDAGEAEESIAQLDAVIKSTGGAAGVTRKEITNLADALEKTTKFTAESTQAADALLLTFTNIGKDVFPEATKIALDMAQALGTDASSGAIQLGKALNDPIAGISALSRVGVSFSEDQKAVIKKLQETGDMAGAQKIILAELNKEFGGSAEAAGKTFAGQLEIAKNALGNVTETIGTALLPKLTEFFNWVTPNLPAIGDSFTKAFDKIILIVPIVVSKIKELWKFAEVNLIPKFKEIIKVAGEISDKYFPDLGSGAGTLKNTLSDLVLNAINLVIDTLKWIRDNSVFVKAAVETITVAWLSYNFALVAVKIATEAAIIVQNIQKAAMIAYNFVMVIATAAQWGYVVAIDTGKISLGLIAAAQWAFNAAMTANPIVAVIAGLALLGLAIYKVIKHWDDITAAIKRAWDWLTRWNGTPAQNKSSTVTTNYRDLGPSGPLTTSHRIGENASGTNNWRGGLTRVNEEGGEIMNLPRGTQIIPHDISVAMAKNQGSTIINFNGSYAFADKNDIDYFMNKGAQLIQRRQG